VTHKLGIIAGGGELPARLIEVCRARDRDVFVVAIEGHAEPSSVEGVDHIWVRLGQASLALDPLRDAGVEELVLAGQITRPSFAELRPNLHVAKFLTKVGKRVLGDDGLLRAIIGQLEEEGFGVVGIDDLLSDLLAEAKTYGSLEPDDLAKQDIERGIQVAKAIGAQDIGQAAVVQQRIVLGVEAVEGTDELLRRCAALRREGPGGVLVKVMKPGQEQRADLPTVGVRTVQDAAAAGLRGIAVEAGGALLVDAKAIGQAADAAGLFVVGVVVEP